MKDADPPLVGRFEGEARRLLGSLRSDLPTLGSEAAVSRLGRVTEVGDGVATGVGLPRAVAGELLDVGGVPARAEIVSEEHVRVVLLGAATTVKAGDAIRRMDGVLEVPAGIDLVGRVVDPLGRPIDGRGALRARRRVAVDGRSAPLIDREPVSRPLRTGIFVVDTMIPVGRGQRQLIVGDRATGKTELGLDVLAALDPEVIGVYVAIGRRSADSSGHLQWLRERGFFEHGFAVVSDADTAVGLIQLTPYTAMAMAEDLMNEGRDVVIVIDNLTAHAHAHRSLALLLGRPVGREAYPVDVFYAHARLLERATQLSRRRGGGSLTAFPIIETQAGDLTAYIPTNLVSITDGQIRLDAALVAEGQVPAVDVGLSVSRVGGKAQLPMVRRLTGQFKNRYAQFLELETFTRFGARLEASAQKTIDWGRCVRLALRQPRGRGFEWAEELCTVLALGDPRIVTLEPERLAAALQTTRQRLRDRHQDIWARLELGDLLSDDELAEVRALLDVPQDSSESGAEVTPS